MSEHEYGCGCNECLSYRLHITEAMLKESENRRAELEVEFDLAGDPIFCPRCGSCGIDGCCADEMCHSYTECMCYLAERDHLKNVIAACAAKGCPICSRPDQPMVRENKP